MSERTPSLFRNKTSLLGLALVFIGLANALFVFLVDLSGGPSRPYIGIFYLIIPAILLVGLILTPIGALFERRRRRKAAAVGMERFPTIDFNNPRHRRLVAFGGVAVLFVVFATGIAGYRTYEITDSVVFCGQLCHTPMKPEFTAYGASPHARVKCTDCHVGSSAASYAKSKFSGIHRAYATLRNNFPRPIPEPIHGLEPARETCENCHWSKMFFGTQLRVFSHYAYDEKNTPLQVRMLIYTGGGSPPGPTMGIHWHMNISNKISYIATDDQRQVIPWVRQEDAQGHVTVYTAPDSKLSPEEIEKAPKKLMDCMDCHNRSAHKFVSPDRAVDSVLFDGEVDASLPYIKEQAVKALAKPYGSDDQAMAGIASDLDAYYKSTYPDIFSSKQDKIKQAVQVVQGLYKDNFFPAMKVDWKTYPDNIGHLYSSGCFRCHDGQHVSSDGKVIRKDCSICHTVLDQTSGSAPLMVGDGKVFQHPLDIGDLTQVTCTDCHTGQGMGQ